jgi:hypothetical protein
MYNEPKMEYRTDVWFSPRKIIIRYHERLKEMVEGKFASSSWDIKQVQEAVTVATALLGIQKINSKEYWLQIIDPREGTPDIRTMTLNSDGSKLEVQDIEVVTMVEEYSEDNIRDFLLRTKLTTKVYPKNTTILCFINKATYIGPLDRILENMEEGLIRNDIVLMGRTDPMYENYQIGWAHPSPHHAVQFNLGEELVKTPMCDVLQTKKSTKPEKIKMELSFEPF